MQAPNAFWGVWALVQHLNSDLGFDYLGYARWRAGSMRELLVEVSRADKLAFLDNSWFQAAKPRRFHVQLSGEDLHRQFGDEAR